MSTFAKAFYESTEWKAARTAYLKKAGYLCERCLRKGLLNAAAVVHHRIHLTEDNIRDPKIRTGFDNLEALCWSCHELEHKGKKRRYNVDASGHVVGVEPPGGSQMAI